MVGGAGEAVVGGEVSESVGDVEDVGLRPPGGGSSGGGGFGQGLKVDCCDPS